MNREPVIRVQWSGRETIPEISQLIRDADRIELQLAPEFNHALYEKLHPEAPRATVEQVDRSGDAGLLDTVSAIAGLEELADLVEVLRAEDASVHIVSPPTIVIELPGGPPAAA